MSSPAPPPTLGCEDIQSAIDTLMAAGFGVETIMPADDPAFAVLRGPNDVRIRLVRVPAVPAMTATREIGPLRTSFVVTRNDPSAWHVGRARMEYRDLIPDRHGGHFIASHVRISDGGPVPDYVHFHAIRFQMIYCYKGWARLVYEDQGPPFVMEAGDCVLQPPKIRHRVLEASPGLEVIEISTPAVHATHGDLETTLPTAQVRADRDFGGQTFLWDRGTAPRTLGIATATNGAAGVRVLDRVEETTRTHAGELLFGFVLAGSLTVTCDETRERLGTADAFSIPAGARYAFGEAKDLALLEVTVPALQSP